MRDWLVAGILTAAVSISPWLFLLLCRSRWIRRMENRILERKFGDVASFSDFISQAVQERRVRK